MEFIISALAAYRIARLIAIDDFPPVVIVRDWYVVRVPEWAEKLVTCMWCIGFWVALVVGVVHHLAPSVWQPVAFVFAASAVVGIISRGVDG